MIRLGPKHLFFFNNNLYMLRLSMQAVRSASTSSKILTNCRRLDGKVAVVTASTQGIGFGIAKRLAIEGAKVIVSSRRETNVNEAVQKLSSEGLDVSGIVCHVSKAEDRSKLFQEAVKKYGGVDIFVSNAATNLAVGPVTECSEAAWDKTFEINVKSTFLLIKESVPFLKKSKSPSIIIISSIAGYQPISLLGVYSVTKTALLGLCKTVAEELSNDGIRVNGIAPGVIETKFSRPLYASESAYDMTMSMIPMQRLGSVDEVASVAAFLASDDASYITGETIVASGGMKSRL